MTTDAIAQSDQASGPFKWWHAALFWLAVNLPGFVFSWREELFPGFLSPPLRPPGILFPFIWFFITVCTLWAGLRILNNRDLNRRSNHISLQGLFWLDFAIFPYFFFGKSSPVIGGALTLLIFFIALIEAATLWHDDRRSSFLMMPLLGWGAFAGLYASTWQILYNPDPYLGLPALLH